MKKIYTTIFISFYLLLAMQIQAQTTETNSGEASWFAMFNNLKLNEKWTFGNELHYRFNDVFQSPGTFLVRPFIQFEHPKNVSYAFGYTFINSKNGAGSITNEHNVWEQILLKYKIQETKLHNRFRWEHRWVNPEGAAVNQVNRFRYRFGFVRDIHTFQEDKLTLFCNVFDEFWVNLNDKLLPTSFARNWVYLGLGVKFDKLTNVQLGYMYQRDQKVDAFDNKHIFQLSFNKNFSLNFEPASQ